MMAPRRVCHESLPAQELGPHGWWPTRLGGLSELLCPSLGVRSRITISSDHNPQPESRPSASADLQPSNEPQIRLFFLCACVPTRPSAAIGHTRGSSRHAEARDEGEIYPVGLAAAHQLMHQHVCTYVCMCMGVI